MSDRPARSTRAHLLTLVLVFAAPTGVAQEGALRDRFADRVWELFAAVETEHISPPPLRALLASGVEQLASVVDAELRAWSTRLPDSGGETAVREFLRELYDAAEGSADPERIVNAMVAGISRRVPGGAMTINAETARVNDSLDANQYVGVGVVLDFKKGLPQITDTFFGGPAHRAGIEAGDVVYEVDGVDTRGMDVARFIDYSRDEVGTELVYVVGRPDSEERRTVRLIRGVVPKETVIGTARGDDEAWEFALSPSAAYVKLLDISASTPHELRQVAERMQREGQDLVILDLIGCRSTRMHPTALVADLFRVGGVLGASATRRARTEYGAGPDALFDATRVAVLVDEMTRGTPEWLAAVLRQGGAAIVGKPTAGVPFLPGRVDVRGWPVQVSMPTGWILDPEVAEASSDDNMGSVQPDVLVQDGEQVIDLALAALDAPSSDR